MSLHDIQLPTYEIAYGGVTICLSPLSLSDINVLLRSHAGSLGEKFARAAPMLADPIIGDGVAAAVLADACEVVADIIALAAGEPGAANAVARLPAAVQLQAVKWVLEATLADVRAVALFKGLRDAVAPTRDLMN